MKTTPGVLTMAGILVCLAGCGGGGSKPLAEQNVAEVCAILSLGEPGERRDAANHLAERGDPKAIPALVRALGDQDFKVRTAVVRALTGLKAENAVDPLGQLLLSGKDPLLAYDAVEAIAKIGGETAIVTLMRVEAGADKDVAERIRTDFLPELLTVGQVPLVRRLAKDGGEELKAVAQRYLKFLATRFPDSDAAKPLEAPTPLPPSPSPSPSPTPRPTPRPTARPTPRPTRRPTPRPTRRPTVEVDPMTGEPVPRLVTTLPDGAGVVVEPTEPATPPPVTEPPSPPPTPPPPTPPPPTRPPPRRGDRDEATRLFRIAWDHEQAQRTDAAILAYRQAVSADPSYADPAFNLGILLDRMKRYPEAAEAYRSSLAANPAQAETRAHLGRVLLMSSRPQEAVQELKIAIKDPAAQPQWMTRLGRALQASGDLVNAAEAYRRAALQRDPDAAFELGRLHESQGRFLEAADAFGTAGTLGRQGADPFYNQGNMYMKAERLDQAERSYLRALQLEPDHTSAHYNLAVLYLKQSRAPEAGAQIAWLKAAGREVSQLEAALSQIR